MPPAILKILIADDDEGDRKLIKRTLKQAEILSDCVETGSTEDALEACETNSFDCALVDYRLPGEDGLAGLAALYQRLPYLALIMLTGQGDERVATEAMKRGASDYLPKSHLQPGTLKRAVTYAVEKATLRREIAQQQDELKVFNRVLVHDLKAPLSSIYSLAALIEEGIHQLAPEQVSGICRRIERAVTRTSALIDTLHQYTRADEHVPFGPVSMNLVMEDALASLDHTIQQRGALVTNAGLPTVWGNAPQLMQLLQNLIGNAIKYCTAEIPSVHVAAQPLDENTWQFTVKDNGIGIAEENARLIFEPFQRLHSADEYEGTGLGLATCRKIVERHGGRIWCESKKGQGATFLFTLKPNGPGHTL